MVHLYENFNDMDSVKKKWIIADNEQMDMIHDNEDHYEMPDDMCLRYNGSNVMFRQFEKPLLEYKYKKFTVGFDVSFHTDLRENEGQWKVAINLYKETFWRNNLSMIDVNDWWLSFQFIRLNSEPRFMVYLYSGLFHSFS